MTTSVQNAGRPAPVPETTSLVRRTRWLTGVIVLTGLVNYAYALGLTHVLSLDDFAVFAAGQALLLTAGTVSSSAMSWILTQTLVRARTPLQRRQAVTFSIGTNVALGLGAAAVVFALALRFASAATSCVLAVAVLLVFLSSMTSGLLRADARFGLLGALNIGEALVKIVVGLPLVAVGIGAAGALAGAGAGSLLLVVAALVLLRRDLQPAPGALRLRSLWASAVGVASVQSLVAVLASVDTVLVALLPTSAVDASTYQASMMLSRAPLFLAGAVGASVYTLVAREPERSEVVMRRAVRLYLVLVLPFAGALATVPPSLLLMVFPGEYVHLSALLPVTAVAGVLIGGVALVATYLQARRAYRASTRAQVCGLVVHIGALLVGFAAGGVLGLAVGAVVGTATSTAVLVLATPHDWRCAFPLPVREVSAAVGFTVLLVLLHGTPAGWFTAAALGGVISAGLAFGRSRDGQNDDQVLRWRSRRSRTSSSAPGPFPVPPHADNPSVT